MGYTYIGEQSFYRLTLSEIRRLARGYELRQQQMTGKYDGGVRPAGVRESDWLALQRFKENTGLN